MAQVNSLFDEVVNRSGLAQVFANKTLSRAFSRAGVDARTLDRDGLKKALPIIRSTISLYLPPEELDQNMLRIEALAR